MNLQFDAELMLLITGVIVAISLASLFARSFRHRLDPDGSSRFYHNLLARIKAWWVMIATFGVALMVGKVGTLIIFTAISFQALREFITMAPTRQGDHRALFWAFFFILPAQYLTIGMELGGFAYIFIPVYAFIFIPIRAALAGETKDFLERTSKVQWGLMVCVYFISYGPGLLTLEIDGYEGENVKLLLFMVIVVQVSDVLQYVWGKSIGKTPVVPKLSPNKTAEGLIGGTLSASLVGACLWWATPFNFWQAGAMAMLLCLMGFFGGLVMSAIKRDRGIKDYGTIIPGHGGMMDRIDSLCFAAPVYYHVVRYFFGQ